MKLSRDGARLTFSDLSGVESDAILGVINEHPDTVPVVSYAESVESGDGPVSVTSVTITWTAPPPPPES